MIFIRLFGTHALSVQLEVRNMVK